MANETNQILHDADDPTVDENKSASGAESEVLVASSFSNADVVRMANKTTPQCLTIGRNR
jgi:hypothetical protein